MFAGFSKIHEISFETVGNKRLFVLHFVFIGSNDLHTNPSFKWKGRSVSFCTISHQSQGGATKSVSKVGYIKNGFPVSVSENGPF